MILESKCRSLVGVSSDWERAREALWVLDVLIPCSGWWLSTYQALSISICKGQLPTCAGEGAWRQGDEAIRVEGTRGEGLTWFWLR